MFDASNIFDTTDNTDYTDVDIELDTIDNMFYDIHPSLIKINAVAADLPILIGGENTIRSYRPTITMDYGAKPEYIVDTIDFIRKCYDGYKLFLRVKKIYGDYKTILYAVG